MNSDRNPEARYLINDVSQRVGLSQKRLREYEKGGLIRPIREPKTNNRRYTEADIRQIERIKSLIHDHGFTIACLKYFLSAAPCWIIFNCGKKETCPTYETRSMPCYELMSSVADREGHRDCSKCPIYLNRDQRMVGLLERP